MSVNYTGITQPKLICLSLYLSVYATKNYVEVHIFTLTKMFDLDGHTPSQTLMRGDAGGDITTGATGATAVAKTKM